MPKMTLRRRFHGMDSVIFIIYAAIYAALVWYGTVLWRKERGGRDWRYLLFLVTAALIWDNAVLGLGFAIGAGPTLEMLNAARYWLHALITPLLVLVSLDLIRKMDAEWAETAAARGFALLYTALLVALELSTSTLGLRLVPKMENGVLQYVNSAGNGSPWMIILVMIPVAAAAFYLWRNRGLISLAVGIAAMAAGALVRVPNTGVWMNGLELVLMTGLWAAVGGTVRKGRKYSLKART